MNNFRGKREIKDLGLAKHLYLKGFHPGVSETRGRVVFWFLDSPKLRMVQREWTKTTRRMRLFAEGLLREKGKSKAGRRRGTG